VAHGEVVLEVLAEGAHGCGQGWATAARAERSTFA
jgi:hypothetical protein